MLLLLTGMKTLHHRDRINQVTGAQFAHDVRVELRELYSLLLLVDPLSHLRLDSG